ncbi:SRPBCC family protein [Aeromicrobium sp.]|uniref:SRPBCC family protein n=1 Tax=Aeromicrobium sp. TaxID=1871063 RepID=UPI002FC622FB
MTARNGGDSTAIDIAATPDRVYDLISDITRMGEWSPECIHCEWSNGADGPAVGARFKARNKGKRGPAWFNKPEVIVADRGREFAFNRSGPGIGSYTWRYRLEPTDNGTTVTESYETVRPLPKAMNWITEKWTGSPDRDADLRYGMKTTLERLQKAAEATS